jgi:hypothetical protein
MIKIDWHSGKPAGYLNGSYRRDKPPGVSAERFTRLAARCVVSPPPRLELQCEGRHLQRAGIAPPHAAGDELSGAASDRAMFAFISVPVGVVGGVPLMRARNPWAMPEASA